MLGSVSYNDRKIKKHIKTPKQCQHRRLGATVNFQHIILVFSLLTLSKYNTWPTTTQLDSR